MTRRETVSAAESRGRDEEEDGEVGEEGDKEDEDCESRLRLCFILVLETS
jgi:hypothetical protein